MRNGEVTKGLAIGLGLLMLMTMPSSAQNNSAKGKKGIARGIAPGIAWYGVLQDGLAEAERTGKAILFVSAAPNCTGVSGIW